MPFAELAGLAYVENGDFARPMEAPFGFRCVDRGDQDGAFGSRPWKKSQKAG